MWCKINIWKHGISFEEAKKIFNEIRYLISWTDMISAKEFDEKFYIVEDKITLTLPKIIKEKIVEVSKKLNLDLENTVKVLLAKEVGVI